MQLHHLLEYMVKYNHDSKHNNKFRHTKKGGHMLITNFSKLLMKKLLKEFSHFTFSLKKILGYLHIWSL